jgi:hypothetical protein
MVSRGKSFCSCIHTALKNLLFYVGYLLQFSSRLCDNVWLQRSAYATDPFANIK